MNKCSSDEVKSGLIKTRVSSIIGITTRHKIQPFEFQAQFDYVGEDLRVF